ncbi:MAG: hypothetical protein IT355_20990 [Gemmatimonadaceae bacterium]|nr:hypothetical protein [Gemmatimonadaceae bacterium]
MNRLARLALVALCAAAPLQGQGGMTEGERAAQQRIDVMLRDFDRRGLPTALLRAKVAEGTAKGASQPRIAEAVALLASRVDSVARLLAPAVSVPELHAGAEALSVGVSAPSLRTLRVAAGRRSAEPYFLFVVRLMRRGVTQEQAVRAARSLIDRQVPTNTLLAIADDFARDVAGGVAPADALNDRMTRLVGGAAASPGIGNAADGFGMAGSNSTRGKP